MDANAIAAAIAAVAGIALLLLQRHFASVDSNKTARQEAQDGLRLALAQGRIDDAARWRKRLIDLGGALVLMACLLAAGCRTQQETLVVGERVRAVDPGESLTIPALQPPAQQWYLVDDVGLAQWLGIMVSKK